MSGRNPYGLTKPCPLCPFRSDIPAYLTKARVREIDRSLVTSEFPCHETTGAKDGTTRPRSEEMHCASALIVLEKSGRSSQMMRIAERLGMYDRRKLDMGAPVFGNMAAMAAAQPRSGRR